ncbi:TRIM2 [Branchiostoma lanceolatum]|uniref:TRIM2 protein n=1 Tax=Branchiostoma lanceolatum TaxID=7740 RepID=A0A8K0E3Z2_BRALA|nr:TRIM2 [Branchiostoma lanceolatum]
MTSKQEERELASLCHVGNTLDDIGDDSTIGYLTDNERYGHNRGYDEVSVLEQTVSSSDSNSAQTKENQAIYLDNDSVETEDLHSKGIYVADNNEAKTAVAYQTNDTCRKEASAHVYECGEDIGNVTENTDATSTNINGIQLDNVISDPTNTDIDGSQPENVIINRLEDGGESAHHVSEWISPNAVATKKDDPGKLTDDLLQPYAVAYDEKDDNAEMNDDDRQDGLRHNPMYVPNVPQPMAPGGNIYKLLGAIIFTSVVVGTLVVLAVLFPVIFKPTNQHEDSGMEIIGNKESGPMKPIEFGDFGHTPGNFTGPTDVVVSPNNEIFVTDRDNRRVQVFTMKGAYLRHFKTVVSEDELDTMEPDSIAIDADCHLWVVGNNKLSGYVVQYTKMGHRMRTLYPSFPNNTFNGVAVSVHRNHVIVAENWKDYSELKVLLFNGTVVRKFGKLKFNRYTPTRVATDSDGNILVSDYRHGGVDVYNETGQHRFSFGDQGDRDYPSSVGGVCVDSSGQVILSYGEHQWVELYTDRGVHVRSIVTNLTSADSVTVGPDGQLVVTSLNDYIVLVLPHY